MSCPICQKEMKIQKKDVSNNIGKGYENYKEYNRIIYWCEKDDAWNYIETPRN